MTDIQVKPHRKTLYQTSIILNVSIRTVRRLLEKKELTWSGNQVTTESIENYLDKLQEMKTEEPIEEVEKKIAAVVRRNPVRSKGWVKDW